MSSKKIKIGEFLKRVKQVVEIQNSIEYKRITIKTKHQGVLLRDVSKGSLIGTKLQFVVTKGQFILSKIDARLGAFGIVPEQLDGAIITGNFWVFDVDETQVNIDWFNLFTSSGNFYTICNQASSGTTHRKYLDEDKFLNFEINLPELYEQHTFMYKYDNYYISYKSLLNEIDQQKTYLQLLLQTILQEAVQGKLTKQRPTDEPATELLKRIKAEKEKLLTAAKNKKDEGIIPIESKEIPYELPNGWVWCRLGELFEVVRGSSPRPKGDSKYFSKERTPFHWISIADFAKHGENSLLKDTSEFLTEEGTKFGRLVTPKDLLIAASGVGSVGKSSRTEISGYIYDGLLAIKNINDEAIMSFIAIFIKVKELEIYSIAAGTNWLNINTSILRNYLFPLPPLAEQQRIVAKVQQLQQQLSHLEAQVQQSRQYANQLLQSVLKDAFEQKSSVYEMEEPQLNFIGNKSFS